VKTVLCISVGIVLDLPDNVAGVGAEVPKSPLEELAARLRREACYGRDCSEPERHRPSVSAFVVTAYKECGCCS
jgi:hypothetical protein